MSEPKEEQKAGYLIMRMKPGEGIVIADKVEVYLTAVNSSTHGTAQIAIKAPKELKIRRTK